MGIESKIEWADSTFNPWIGCTKVGPGCDHCYAEADMDKRRHRVKWGAGNPRSRTSEAYWKQPLWWNKLDFVQCPECGWRGDWDKADKRCGACPDCNSVPRLFTPARRRVFCASLSDWLDNEASATYLADLLSLIAATPNIDWLMLSKRIGNWRVLLTRAVDMFEHQLACGHGHNAGYAMSSNWLRGEPPSNVWLGATVVNQAEADRDVPKLLAIPAAKRFLSIEPMLGDVVVFDMDGPIDIPAGFASPLDWVICGGESGPHARPMHPDWARSLRDQCKAAGVPFLFKQWGEWAPVNIGNIDAARGHWFIERDGTDSGEWPIAEHSAATAHMVRVGKKAAGRLLDGIEHNGVTA